MGFSTTWRRKIPTGTLFKARRMIFRKVMVNGQYTHQEK